MTVAVGIAAIFAGLAVGVAGCASCFGCRNVQPIERGSYEVVSAELREELVGALVEIEATQMEISFADADDNDWVIDYTLVGEVPGE